MRKASTTAIIVSLFLSIVSLFLPSAAFAEGEGFTVKVGRDYNVSTKTDAVTSVAIGKNAHSAINVGGMQLQNTHVDIGRDYKVNVQAGAVTSVAIGESVSSRINLGGIQSHQ